MQKVAHFTHTNKIHGFQIRSKVFTATTLNTVKTLAAFRAPARLPNVSTQLIHASNVGYSVHPKKTSQINRGCPLSRTQQGSLTTLRSYSMFFLGGVGIIDRRETPSLPAKTLRPLQAGLHSSKHLLRHGLLPACTRTLVPFPACDPRDGHSLCQWPGRRRLLPFQKHIHAQQRQADEYLDTKFPNC